MKKNINVLTESAICIALATILSLITVYRVPYGGSITVLSMLPVCLFSYRRGIRAGLMCGFAHGVLQMILGIAEGVFKGADLASTVGMAVLDYIVAFTVLGLAGVFKGKIKNTSAGFSLGCAMATLLRYAAHILSGYIFFRSYAEWFFSQEGFTVGERVLETFDGNSLCWLYTVVYNGSYMIPEIILTVAAAFVVGRYEKIMTSAK